MTPEEIKARLDKKGLTQGDLHRRWKEPRPVVSMLVNRKLKSRRLERKLARALGVTLAQLIGNERAA